MDELRDTTAFYSCASTECTGTLELITTGADFICNSNSQTYKLDNLSSSATINWNVSPSNNFTLTQNGNNITLIPIGGYNGSAILTASVGSNCENVSITKTIWVGKPKLTSAYINGSANVNCNSTYIYKFMGGVLGAENTRWEVSLQFDNVSAVNNKTLYVDPTNRGSGYVTFVASNACGETVFCKPVNVSGSSCGPAYINFPNQYSCGDLGFDLSSNSNDYMVLPNPASNSFTIVDTQNKTVTSTYEEITYQLYDLNAFMTLNGRLKNSRTVNANSLKKGLYILKIQSQTKVEYHRILIE